MTSSDTTRRRRARTGSLLTVAAVMTVFVGTATVDHGYNWDEWALIEGTRESVKELKLVQPRHIYNGFYQWCAMAVVITHGLDDLPGALAEIHRPTHPFTPQSYASIARWQTEMYRLLASERFKIEVRWVFVGLSSLAILWVFLTVLRLYPGRYWQAAGAAALMGLSWEIAVRARCTEVDSPQMMLVALHVYLLSVALTTKTKAETVLAVMGVGAATSLVFSCKMTGALLVVPSLLLVWFVPTHRTWRDRLLLVLAGFVGVCLTFAFFAPEQFTDPFRVIHQSFMTAGDYRSVGPGYPFYVEAPFEHFFRIQLWTFLVAPSAVLPVAAGLSLVALYGFRHLARSRRAFASLAAIYPLAVVTTMSSLSLLQQRNFLQLFPYVCVAFGAGLVAVRARVHDPRPRRLLAAAVAAAFVFNAAFLFRAQRSVRDTTRDSILEDVRAHIAATDHDFYVSPRLRLALDDTFEEGFVCVPALGDEGPELHDPRLLMYYTDHVPRQWLSVRMGFVERTFAPLDQNYDWYATWKGHLEHHRVVLMSIESATAMQVNLDRMLRCRRR